MSHLKANSWLGAVIFAVLCSWGLTLHLANASEAPPKDAALALSTLQDSVLQQHEVTFQRDRDRACTQCHQEEKNKLSGIHGDVINTQTGQNFTCIDCHTSITSDHRDGAKDVMKYTHAQSVKGLSTAAEYIDSIVAQNESCVSCHEATTLQKANWTHDVHAQNLSCASCHVVHPQKDPMKGITEKAKIQTCVDCHSSQYKASQYKAREKDK